MSIAVIAVAALESRDSPAIAAPPSPVTSISAPPPPDTERAAMDNLSFDRSLGKPPLPKATMPLVLATPTPTPSSTPSPPTPSPSPLVQPLPKKPIKSPPTQTTESRLLGTASPPSPASIITQPSFTTDLDLAARSRSAAALAPSPDSSSNPGTEPTLGFSNIALTSTLDLTAAAPSPEPPVESAIGTVGETGLANRTIEQSVAPPAADGDPELGVLRVREVPGQGVGDNPALPANPANLQPAGCIPDPELGCLRLKDVPVAPPRAVRAPIAYLLGRFDYFRTSNVYSGILPISDGLSRPGISLYLVPPLGPNTFFVGSVDGNLVRYSSQFIINYDELRFRAGIMQRLSPAMFAEVGWGNQQLFIRSNDLVGLPKGKRFLNDHGIRVELSRRDRLANKLTLNSFYQLRIGFAEPSSLSRLSNTLFLSLNYDLLPKVQLGLDYQVVLVRFTQTQRRDSFHQVIARLSYTLFRNVQVNVFGGYSFGDSSDPLVDFDGSVFGASLSFSLGLF